MGRNGRGGRGVSTTTSGPANHAEHFYVDVINLLQGSGIPFMIGGAYAMREYAGIFRDTKDLDVFCKEEDYPLLLVVLRDACYVTEVADPVWIAKAFCGDYYVDLIFNSGNGVCAVDDAWLEYAPTVDLLGCQVKLTPAEELIWSKAFVQHRERFDGTDIAHVIRRQGHKLDWARLLRRMDAHWEVLLTHLIAFRYAYPGERDTVPRWLMEDLLGRVKQHLDSPPPPTRVCRGTLIAGPHYDVDVTEWGYVDARDLEGRRGDRREESEEREANKAPRRGARRPPHARDVARAVPGAAG